MNREANYYWRTRIPKIGHILSPNHIFQQNHNLWEKRLEWCVNNLDEKDYEFYTISSDKGRFAYIMFHEEKNLTAMLLVT